MVDKACKKCSWYDPVYVCTCPNNEPWQCPLDKEAAAQLDRAIEELNMDEKNEVRLINANDALEKLKEANQIIGIALGDICVEGCNAVSVKAVMHFIERLKTVDAVEVVRCKDCIYAELAEDGDLYCDGPIGVFGTVGFNDFCSCGERKDNG